jgi:hypothetical protein
MKKRSGLAALVASFAGLATSGCTFATTYVGEHVARDKVAHRLCIGGDEREASSPCDEVVDVPSREQERAFRGGSLILPAADIAHAKYLGSEASTVGRVELGAQYILGQGRWAYGLRGSFLFEAGHPASTGMRMTPVTALGYVSVAPRLNLHGGIGYAPYTYFGSRGGGGTFDATVVRGLVGTDILLVRGTSVALSLNLELDTMTTLSSMNDFRSTGITGAFALNF